MEFYLEDLTGQNNSIIKDYHYLSENIQFSGLDNVKIESVKIPCTTLDDFVNESVESEISFIKIDIEGAELMAIQGAKGVLKTHKLNMMIEVTKDYKEVFDILSSFQYTLYTPTGEAISDYKSMSSGNVFCLNSKDSINKFLHIETSS